jgi:hypothetical protein
MDRIGPELYATYYWNTETLGVALRCLVVWELFRHAFPSGSGLRRTVSRGFGVVAVGLLVFTVGALWSYEAYARLRSMNLTLDRSFGFAQSIFILIILLTARYYGVQLGRNLWGIAVGFGAWISMSTVNYAMFDLMGSFFPYWRFLRPLSFVGLLAVWTWALWRASPRPYLSDGTVPAADLDNWTEHWNRTQSSLRRVKPS